MSLPDAFTIGSGTCSRDSTPQLPAGKAPDTLTVPSKATQEYASSAKDGKIKLAYKFISGGGEYCTSSDSSDLTTFGGSVVFRRSGKCHPAPMKPNGKPCCQLRAWQPNSRGYYYSNCSMKCAYRCMCIASSHLVVKRNGTVAALVCAEYARCTSDLPSDIRPAASLMTF